MGLAGIVPDPLRIVAAAFTIILLAAPSVAAEGPSSELVSTWDVSVDGSVSTESTGCRLWLRPFEGRADGQHVAGFELTAGRVDIEQRAYTARSVQYAGQNAFYRMEEPTVTPSSFAMATVTLDLMAPEGQMRAILGEGAGLNLESPPAHGAIPTAKVYPDASMAQDFNRAKTPTYLDDDPINEFFLVPEDRFLFSTQDASVRMQGPFELWVYGADLLVRHDGGATPLRGHPERTTVTDPAGRGIVVEQGQWVDYVIRVPADGSMRVQWTDAAELFATDMLLRTDGDAEFPRASGSFEAADGAVEALQDESLTLDGPLLADVDYLRQGSQHASRWTLLAEAPVEGGDASPIAGFGAASWWWLVFLAVGLVAGGGSGVFAVHQVRLARSRPGNKPPGSPHPIQGGGDAFAGPPAPPKTPAKAGEAALLQGIALANEGRFDAAVGPLQEGVKASPTDPEARYMYGLTLARLGRAEDAVAEFEFAVRLDSAMLGLFVTDPHTESFRHDAVYARFVKRQARDFRDNHHRGYA